MKFKNLLLFGAAMLISQTSFKKPAFASTMEKTVDWSLACKTITSQDSTKDAYVVSIDADIHEPWHLFSQYKNGIGQPTQFVIQKDPALTFSDTLTEVGEMIIDSTFAKDTVLAMSAPEKFYKNKVTFLDTIYAQKGSHTNWAAAMTFMTCKEEQCMQPITKNFSIPLKDTSFVLQ